MTSTLNIEYTTINYEYILILTKSMTCLLKAKSLLFSLPCKNHSSTSLHCVALLQLGTNIDQVKQLMLNNITTIYNFQLATAERVHFLHVSM